ncbi:MAG: type IV-A pilus assembly ATPase PilB [Gammaproteobacteria bacterium]|nr:MAG: type IV-A pilus assembly ATPase PilB [Gammaproteobacteria bacterium]
MATSTDKIILSGLARQLVLDNLLTEDNVITYQSKATSSKLPFVSYLVINKILDSRTLANCASVEFGAPLFDLDAMDLEVAPVKLVKEKLIRKHHALPLYKRGSRLFVAVSDPTNLQALDEIKFHTGLNTEAILVEENKLTKTIEKALEAAETSINDILADDIDLDNIEISSGEEDDTDELDSGVDDTPIVRFVNKILLDAINKGASDIHLEPYEKEFRIRFRNDGMLSEIASPPTNLANRIISRLKVMSRMNIAERRVPQDGRIVMALSKNRSIDFRVNTLPTLHGEKVVLRILDPTSAQMGIEALGFEDDQKKHFIEAINKPYGMVLVTGPTGSGKTVTLYTGLNMLNSPERNISTAEDPVEITVTGINQVNVNVKTGLTFATALRAFLRQDPDIIMVGEIRDLETAEISVKAAQTGHMVLSTLHTNDAPQTLTRLSQMGVPAFNIASSVVLIMAQRLARRLCLHCKEPADLPKDALLEAGFSENELNDLTVYHAVGCDQCVKGYKGRVGIYQVMPISDEMGRLIMENRTSIELADQAKKEGVKDLRESGLNKIRSGLTSIEEIDRVTRE